MPISAFLNSWEQCKLGDLLKERNEQIIESDEYPLMSFVQNIGVVPKGDRYDRSFLIREDSKKYKITKYGDFIYSSNNLDTGSIGVNYTGNAVISPVYSIFQENKELGSRFVGLMSKTKLFIHKMMRFRQGVVYGQLKIHEKDFLNIIELVPSLEERKQYIIFFSNFDKLITHHQ